MLKQQAFIGIISRNILNGYERPWKKVGNVMVINPWTSTMITTPRVGGNKRNSVAWGELLGKL